MKKILKCSRCHEKFVQLYKSRMGQICPLCERDLIELDAELSYKCGIRPMTRRDVVELNRCWIMEKVRKIAI